LTALEVGCPKTTCRGITTARIDRLGVRVADVPISRLS